MHECRLCTQTHRIHVVPFLRNEASVPNLTSMWFIPLLRNKAFVPNQRAQNQLISILATLASSPQSALFLFTSQLTPPDSQPQSALLLLASTPANHTHHQEQDACCSECRDRPPQLASLRNRRRRRRCRRRNLLFVDSDWLGIRSYIIGKASVCISVRDCDQEW